VSANMEKDVLETTLASLSVSRSLAAGAVLIQGLAGGSN